MRASTAQALELLFLKNTQEFGLQAGRNISHLVQKEGSFVGHFEATNLLRDGAGKSAFLVAKKLAFQKIERNSSAIQLCERASTTRAEIVNRASDEFLTGTGFSLNQNRGIGGRNLFDLLEHRFQGWALAYDLLESTRITVLFPSPDCS
jgi:hypothetical protein